MRIPGFPASGNFADRFLSSPISPAGPLKIPNRKGLSCVFTFLRCTCKPAGECLHLRTGVSASNTRARKYFGTFSPCLPDEQWISHQSLHREYSVLILYENCGIVVGSEMRIHGNIPKRILKNDPRTFSGSPNIHQQHRRVLAFRPFLHLLLWRGFNHQRYRVACTAGFLSSGPVMHASRLVRPNLARLGNP